MTENISERIDNAIKDIEKIQIMFRQKYGEECLADKEIEEVLKIAKKEHEEIQQYRSIGTVEECREAVERKRKKKPVEKNLMEFKVVCPKCGGLIESHSSHKYCYYCGQAISWEESEGEDD